MSEVRTNSITDAAGTGAPDFPNGVNAATALIVKVDETERMRISQTGNVLIGKTAADSGATAGVQLEPDGLAYFTRTGSAAVFNRLSTDGSVVEFRKDGTTVGSIGSSSGNSIFVGSGDVGVRFSDVNDAIYPITTGGINRDAATDLGLSTVRFKDLYLSGGVSNPAAGGTLTFGTVGAERMRIDSSGNVGIGTSSPTAGYRLDVFGQAQIGDGGGNADINFNASSTGRFLVAGTERFRVASAGQLGIGGANYGTSGQVLTSGGSGAAPSWATPAAPTSAEVGTATAGLAVDSVGSYALLYQTTTNTARAPGATVAGSTLRFTGCAGVPQSVAASGTWRIMGALPSTTAAANSTSLWLRIS